MVEPEQILEEYPLPQGMLVLENASLYVELEANVMPKYNQKC